MDKMGLKISLLIATGDRDYSEHLSRVLSQKYADSFDITVCSDPGRLRELLTARRFNVALLDPAVQSGGAEMSSVRLTLRLGEDVQKYQRISHLVSDILEKYAKVAPGRQGGASSARANITAVFAPCGGVGKTTVALSWALQQAKKGRQAMYFTLEPFSSAPAYFHCGGKSVSAALCDMESVDLELLLQSVCQTDDSTGVIYFCPPNNYDDMNILTEDEISLLVNALAGITEELVIDLPSLCDGRAQRVLDMADKVFLVTDQTSLSAVKLHQFTTQHNVYETHLPKATLIANKGAKVPNAAVMLPYIQSGDAMSVAKALSNSVFGG